MSVAACTLLPANAARIAYLPWPSVKDADKPAMLQEGGRAFLEKRKPEWNL